MGPGFLRSASKFNYSSFSFGRIYAFLSISISFSRNFKSSILGFLLLSFFICPRGPSNHGYHFLLLGQEPLGILETGYSDSSYPQVPPRSLLGLSCKMVVQDPFVGYIQVPRAFISKILPSLQVFSSSRIGAPRDPRDGSPSRS